MRRAKTGSNLTPLSWVWVSCQGKWALTLPEHQGILYSRGNRSWALDLGKTLPTLSSEKSCTTLEKIKTKRVYSLMGYLVFFFV
jgi:hypothetical protein